MSTESEYFILGIEVVIFVLIFIPTMIAFITGAPWVPTPNARVRKMLELGKIQPGQRIYDLGCGDGRIPHLAAKEHKADAIGLELSPLVYAWARIRGFFLNTKAKILLRDFRRIHLGDANVLFFYLLPDTLKKLRPKFESELSPGARIVSYAFAIEGWEPVYIEPKNPQLNHSRILVYEFPQSLQSSAFQGEKSQNPNGIPANK